MAAFEAWLVFLILVVNVVGELQRKRTLAASRGFLAAARLSCFSFESNLKSNRPSDSFSNRIFESNRCLHFTLTANLIHRYFVFVTNESDVRTTELRTEYLFISIQS